MTAALMTMASVAALSNDMPQTIYCSTKPLEPGKRLELEKKYGQWAVESAIAVCPLGDIECIEREAKRLSETRLRRR